jgi:hypothetical protein
VRVRLIKPVLLEIARFDPIATRATGGFDADFGTVRVATEGGRRVSERIDKAPIRLRGQFEDQSSGALRMFGAGDSPEFKFATASSYRDLEAIGLVGLDGSLGLKVNDRLLGTYTLDGRSLQIFRRPGLYAVEVRPAAVGLDRGVGIVLVRWNDRALSQEPA